MSVKFEIPDMQSSKLLMDSRRMLGGTPPGPGGQNDAWISKVWNQVSNHINDEDFPCIFAKKAMADNFLLLAFIDGWESVQALDHFCACVMEYVSLIKDRYNLRKDICTPFMAIFKPAEGMDALHHYSNASWYILQYLHYQDKFEWPDGIPTDPEDPLWSFCFNGCQLFVNVTSPVLGKHRSRVLSDSLILTIQPRTNFDIVAGKDTPFGQKVRDKIRERWKRYDGLEYISDLGMYGDDHNHEWKQYFLYSEKSPAPARCPLNIKSK